LAYVQLNGQFIYLGPYGSPGSRAEYERVVSEWLARGRQPILPHVSAGPSVNEILLSYLKFAQPYYRGSESSESTEYDKIVMSVRPLKTLYGATPAAEFGPVALKSVRQKMIQEDLARTTINGRISCIKRCFRWAASEEMIPPSVYHGLQAVAGLKRFRTEAREPDPVRPVPDPWVDAVLPFLTPTVAAMVRLQRLTGARSGELCIMRGCDIETNGSVWLYRPSTHKTAHHGHERIIQLGPQAQAILKPFVSADPDAYVFSPSNAREERYALLRATRKTKVQPSQRNRRKRRPKWEPGERYHTKSYHRAVCYGLKLAKKAKVLPETVHWHPHRLRHSCATRIRREHGLDAARAVLGHRSLAITDAYAELDSALAAQIAGKVG
jgi:integrase